MTMEYWDKHPPPNPLGADTRKAKAEEIAREKGIAIQTYRQEKNGQRFC